MLILFERKVIDIISLIRAFLNSDMKEKPRFYKVLKFKISFVNANLYLKKMRLS